MCVIEYVIGVRIMCKDNDMRWLIWKYICNLYKGMRGTKMERLRIILHYCCIGGCPIKEVDNIQ